MSERLIRNAATHRHPHRARRARARARTRTLGDPPGVEPRFRALIAAGEVLGPRLGIVDRAFRPSHGTAQFLATVADGPEALQQGIRENFYTGADWLKLFITNVMHGPSYEDYLRGDLTDVAAYSTPEIEAAIECAHGLGMPVAAHAIGGEAMRAAIRAGIDSIEHANLADPADVELFVEHGTFLSDPNLQLFFDSETGFESFSTWRWDWWREKVERVRDDRRGDPRGGPCRREGLPRGRQPPRGAVARGDAPRRPRHRRRRRPVRRDRQRRRPPRSG